MPSRHAQRPWMAFGISRSNFCAGEGRRPARALYWRTGKPLPLGQKVHSRLYHAPTCGQVQIRVPGGATFVSRFKFKMRRATPFACNRSTISHKCRTERAKRSIFVTTT